MYFLAPYRKHCKDGGFRDIESVATCAAAYKALQAEGMFQFPSANNAGVVRTGNAGCGSGGCTPPRGSQGVPVHCSVQVDGLFVQTHYTSDPHYCAQWACNEQRLGSGEFRMMCRK